MKGTRILCLCHILHSPFPDAYAQQGGSFGLCHFTFQSRSCAGIFLRRKWCKHFSLIPGFLIVSFGNTYWDEWCSDICSTLKRRGNLPIRYSKEIPSCVWIHFTWVFPFLSCCDVIRKIVLNASCTRWHSSTQRRQPSFMAVGSSTVSSQSICAGVCVGLQHSSSYSPLAAL